MMNELLKEWWERFDLEADDFVFWPELYPNLLDTDNTNTAPSLEKFIKLLSPENKASSPEQAFQTYINKGELAAARRVMELFNFKDKSFNTTLIREKDEQKRRLDHIISEITSMMREGHKLNLSPQEISSYNEQLEEFKRLQTIERLGPAAQIIQEQKSLLEGTLEKTHRIIDEDIKQLKNSLNTNSLGKQIKHSAAYHLKKAAQFKEDDELRLALEAVDKARIVLEGQVSEVLPVRTEDNYFRHPEKFPDHVYVNDVQKWLTGKQPYIEAERSEGWQKFLEEWAPNMRVGSKDEDQQRFKNVSKCLTAFKAIDNRKIKGRMTQPCHFTRALFQCLPVGVNFAPEKFMSIPHANEDNLGVGFCKMGMFWKGSFLHEDKLGGRGLPFLIWKNPRQYDPGAFLPALKAYGLGDQIGVVFTTEDSIPMQHRLSFKDKFPNLALFDGQTLLKVLIAPTATESMNRFVAEIASQIRPQLINPFMPSGPASGAMFFGRENLMAELLDPNGPSVIFGGRKLGKSSLLRACQRKFQEKNKRFHIAIYIDIFNRGIIRGSGIEVLNKILDELRSHPITNNGGVVEQELSGLLQVENCKQFEDQIKTLCRNLPKHKFLFLIDEADAFMDSLSGRIQSYLSPDEMNIGRSLRGLHFETYGQVDFIFAGFQEINRAANDPNGPFVNFKGKPTAIQALEREEAYELVASSLSLLGLKFTRPWLIERILEYTGNHPALIQDFCQRLFYRVRDRTSNYDTAPYPIESYDVDSVFSDADYRKQLVNMIEMNLLGHSRAKRILKLILYLWIHWLYKPSNWGHNREIVTPKELYENLEVYFGRDSIRSHINFNEVQEYLHDLEVLGVLKRTDLGGYYLNNQYYAQLLYENEYLETAINKIWEDLTQVSSEPSRRQIKCEEPVGQMLSPLTGDDEDVWQRMTGKQVWFMGSSLMGKSLITNWLRQLPGVRDETALNLTVDLKKCKSAQDLLDALGSKLGMAAPVSKLDVQNKLVEWSQDVSIDQPAILILENADGFNLEDWLEWNGGGIIEWLYMLYKVCSKRIRFALTGTYGLARIWNDWGEEERIEKIVAPILLKRFSAGEKDRWVDASGLVAADDASQLLWDYAQGDPRVLTAFIKFMKLQGKPEFDCKEVKQFKEEVLSKEVNTSWKDQINEAASQMDNKARAALMVCRKWALFDPDFKTISQPVLELLLDDGTEIIEEVASSLNMPEILSWSYFQWEQEIKLLVDLNDLMPPAAPQDGEIAQIAEKDLWHRLVCGE